MSCKPRCRVVRSLLKIWFERILILDDVIQESEANAHAKELHEAKEGDTER